MNKIRTACGNKLTINLISRSRAGGVLDSRWTSTSEGARASLHAESATLADAGEYVLGAGASPRKRVRLEVHARGVDAAAGTELGGEPLFLRRLTDLAVKVGARTRLIVEIQSETELQVSLLYTLIDIVLSCC